MKIAPRSYSFPPRISGPVGESKERTSPLPEDSLEFTPLGQLDPAEKAELEALLRHDHVPGELLVKFRGDDASPQSVMNSEIIEEFDLSSMTLQETSGALVRIKLDDPDTILQHLEEMALDPGIEYAVPNHRFQLLENTPNDLDPKLWGMHNEGQDDGVAGADIAAKKAWQTNTGKAQGGPLVAIVDTGIDYHHPDLKNNIYVNPKETANGRDDDGNGVVDDIHGYNAYHDNGDPLDGHRHGTHVAGTVAAEGNNGQGVVGVNWQAELLPVKIFSDDGLTSTDAIIRGVTYAYKMGARITSHSWGGGNFNRALQEVMKEPTAFHIAAAGNSNSNNDERNHFPSNFEIPNMVAVAASDRKDDIAGFSNYGIKQVDLAAPGVDIYSTIPGGKYDTFSGTSMATPHVSGAAALVVNAHPGISNEDLRTRLIWSSDKNENFEHYVGSGGRLNVARAIEQDHVAPAPATDFRAKLTDTHTAKVSWTSTGDDGWEGEPAASEVKFSRTPITAESFRTSAGTGLVSASPSGESDGFQVNFPPSGQDRTYHLAHQMMDNVGHRSTMQTNSVTVKAVPVAFEDDMESGTSNWTADGDWTRVEIPGHGGVWTEADGDYKKGDRGTLQSRVIDLSQFRNPQLHMDVRMDTQKFRDNVFLEVTEDGEEWTRLDRFTGKSEWSHRSYDLSGITQEKAQFRFHTWTNDPDLKTDGFFMDNLVVTGEPRGKPVR